MAPVPQKFCRIWVHWNGRTLGLAAVLLAMCYAGASQSNGAAYLLCFLLTSLSLVSLAHAWANLHGLAISVESIAPVFVGEEFLLPLAVATVKGRTHFGIGLAAPGAEPASRDVISPRSPSRIEVRLPAGKRGRYRTVQLEVTSDYPLGFFTAKQRVNLAHDYYVYPAPRGSAPLPRTIAPTRQPREGTQHEGDDFGGVRMWRPGESQRHIDWKAAARNDVLLTKQWTGEVDDILRFDWSALPGLDPEDRLSQLCKWIILAERGFETYALTLPGKTIRAARGDKHFHECLRALATFETSPIGRA